MKSKIIVFALTFILQSGIAFSMDSFEVACRELPDPTPVITLVKPDVTHNYSLSSMQISRLASVKNFSYLNDGRITTGLVIADINTRIGMNVAKILKDSTGRVCGKPQVNISLEINKYDLYVGREFRPGSCEFNEILSHEIKHAQIYEQNIPLLRDYLEKLAWYFSSPVTLMNMDEMKSYLSRVQDYVGSSTDNEIKKISDLQKLIDTHEEYERLDLACNKNIRNLIEK